MYLRYLYIIYQREIFEGNKVNLRNIDLNLLTVFDAVMTEGNITRAAEKIGMSQPAMSIAISRFRHIADDKLFERTGRGVKPTPRALELSGPVSRALVVISSALEHGTEFDLKTSERSFNLGFGDYGELVILPRLAQRIAKVDSNIRLNTLPTAGIDMQKEMHFENIDLYLWLVPLENSEIRSTQIGTMDHACIVRKDHPSIKDSISIEQYADLAHVVYELPGAYGPSLIDRELWRHNLKRKRACEVYSFFHMPRIISSTDMIATMPRPMAEAYASIHNLKIIPAPIPAEMAIFLMWHKRLDNDTGHQWLRNAVIEIQASL